MSVSLMLLWYGKFARRLWKGAGGAQSGGGRGKPEGSLVEKGERRRRGSAYAEECGSDKGDYSGDCV